MLTLLRRMWCHLRPRRRRQFGGLLLMMIMASLAEVVSIGAVLPFLGVLASPERIFQQPLAQPIIHALGIDEPGQLLFPMAAMFAVAALFSGVMRLTLLWIQTRFGHGVGADFSMDIYRRTLYQPYAVHLGRNSSEVIAGISTKVNMVVHHVILPSVIILSSISIAIFILFALIAIDPWVAVGTFLGFGLIYFFIVIFTRKLLIRNSQTISREQSKVVKALQEGFGGIRDVLIDGTQEAYCNIYRNADLPLRQAMANVQIASATPRYGIEAIGLVLVSLLSYSLAGRDGGIISAIPLLGALALGAQRLLPTLQQSYASWSLMRGEQSSLNDVLILLDQPLPAHSGGDVAPMPFHHAILLDNLCFRYAAGAPLVLDGLNLSIPKGSRVGFVGKTGSGKSTLLDVVMGLLYPTQGALLIDGKAITGANHRKWQEHIAHVPQSIFLADATIAENIAFGVPLERIDHQRVRAAAEQAQLAQTIESWDKQYMTWVGERGVRLSGGQRQRIAIARALYKNCDVIVLDEATSALDSNTESAVMNAIEMLSGDITVLIVAHRLTTLKQCSTIVELVDGKINRQGSYVELFGD